MKNKYFHDIEKNNQNMAEKIEEDSRKINTENILDDTVLETIYDEHKRIGRIHKGIYAITSVVAACIILVVGVRINMNTGNNTGVKSIVAQKDTKSSEAESAGGLTYAQIYEKLSAVDVIDGADADAEEGKDSLMDSGSSVSKVSSSGTEDFYNTNEQTDGVHEGDIVKTDGKYIYTLTRDEDTTNYYVVITKADGKELEKVSEITIGNKENSEYYFDNIYVENERLIAIGSSYGYLDFVCNDTIYGGKGGSTVIYVYDLSDIKTPNLLSKNIQDGSYVSSRLADGVLYSVSTCYLSEISEEKCVPTVNGKIISGSDVYISNNLDSWSYTIITTLDVYSPEDYKQVTAVAGGTNTLYASRDNLYLIINSQREENIIDSEQGEKTLESTNLKKYSNQEVKIKKRQKNYIQKKYKDLDLNGMKAYRDTGVYLYTNTTEIMKFSYNSDGMELVADTIVDGSTDDNMSFDEKDNYLRFVATNTTRKSVEIRINYYDKDGKYLFNVIEETRYISSGESSNDVYVLDEKLIEKARIEGLAENETIYAARYLGDRGYFVTYRDTDPLFSVDFSDMENPKIVGELKISGFSEYLHFYAEDKLFGLGRETNSKNGRWLGIKLEMYDITRDEAKVESKLVLEDFDAPALYNYKELLIDPEKSLIGFFASDGKKYKTYYMVYSYENNEFKELMRITINDDTRKNENSGYNIRGFYINEYLYVVDPGEGIKVIDLQDYDNNKITGQIKF